MSLRLKRMLTSEDIGVPTRVGPREFWRLAEAKGFPRVGIRAFVPLDIEELVTSMHRPMDAPPQIRAIFDRIDEDAVIAANFAYAAKEFDQLDSWLPRRGRVAAHGSTAYPYRRPRRMLPPRNIHVVAAASPRPVSAEYPTRSLAGTASITTGRSPSPRSTLIPRI